MPWLRCHAGKEEVIAIEQGRVAACVPRGRNGKEAGRQIHRSAALDQDFGVRLGGFLQLVNDAPAVEFARVFFSVGYIVAVSEKDVAYAAGFVKFADQVTRPARRVDQPIAGWMAHEVTRSTE